jgi:unsaturated rhamnogalacturonyl hydrolase
MRKIQFAFLFILCLPVFASTKTIKNDSLKWSERMAISIMKRNPNVWQIDDTKKLKWDYKPSFVLTAFENLYKKTNKSKYCNYIKEYIDTFVDSNGTIGHYDINEYNLDAFNPGKLLFNLSEFLNNNRYQSAIELLSKQLKEQPRTPSGGFWHKKIYPNQMWMDGLYMALPFYTRYTVTYENGKSLDDIAKQFELIHDNAFDAKSKLPFHAWDESKQIAWANTATGTSPTIWSRGAGFYAMALVDVLDYFPKNHPKYNELVGYLNEISKAIVKKQDKSGLWFQIMDKTNSDGNYLEASGTAMFAYVFAKGVTKGYLPKKYKKCATKAFDGLLKNVITVDQDGEIHLSQISQGIGLGGTPFRDGSNKYYADVKKNIDNSIGVGAFILAALELNR